MAEFSLLRCLQSTCGSSRQSLQRSLLSSFSILQGLWTTSLAAKGQLEGALSRLAASRSLQLQTPLQGSAHPCNLVTTYRHHAICTWLTASRPPQACTVTTGNGDIFCKNLSLDDSATLLQIVPRAPDHMRGPGLGGIQQLAVIMLHSV